MPLARLTIGERLGRGSFGTVDAVQVDGASLALKRISLVGTAAHERARVVAVARRDFRALRQLVHTNIVELLGVVLDETDSIGLLLERALHGSLRSKLDISPRAVVGEEHVQLRLAAGIANGMAFLHAQTPPVLHHDLKSDNVLLFDGADGQLAPKLTDFGLAVNVGGSTASLRTLSAGAGTVAYQAPEQFEEEPQFSEANEVYSYAVVLLELLHGGRPWAGRTPGYITHRVCNREQRPPEAGTLPDSFLKQLMVECWAQAPANRPMFASIDGRRGAPQPSTVSLEASCTDYSVAPPSTLTCNPRKSGSRRRPAPLQPAHSSDSMTSFVTKRSDRASCSRASDS